MTRAPFALGAAVAAAGALILIPQQALANGCLQAPVWDAATSTYTITTATQLRTLSQGACDMSATIRLANDIDLTGTGEFQPIGSAANQDPFTGTFDGGGHSVTGLEITNPTEDGYGLIGTADGATIRNVSVSGTIVVPTTTNYGGLLVGKAQGSTITGATVTGTVHTPIGAGGVAGTTVGGSLSGSTSRVTVSAGQAAGGLVGIMSGGTLTNSSASATVTGTIGAAGGVVGSAYVSGAGRPSISRVRSDGSVTADADLAGGVAGSINGASVSASSTTTSVRGRFAGGLVGYAEADGAATTITDAFSTGQVSGAPTGAAAVGGIVGRACTGNVSLVRTYFAGTLQPAGAASGGIVGESSTCASSVGPLATTEGNLWNSDTAGPAGAGSPVGVGRTTAQMKQIGTYTALGWSIVNGWEPAGSSTWGICPQVNDGFPFLQSTGAGSACAAPTPAATNAIPPLLEATVLPSRRRVVSGQALRIGIRARNTGGSEASSVVSCVRLPAGLVLVRAPGAARSGRVACFRMGTVAAKGQATRVVTARAATLARRSVTVTGTTKASGLSRVNAAPVAVTVVPRAARARVTG